jgi:hypothetical protein
MTPQQYQATYGFAPPAPAYDPSAPVGSAANPINVGAARGSAANPVVRSKFGGL